MKNKKLDLTDRCVKDLTNTIEKYMVDNGCSTSTAMVALFKSLSELNNDAENKTVKLTFRCPIELNTEIERYMIKHNCNISTALRNILYWVKEVGGFDIMD